MADDHKFRESLEQLLWGHQFLMLWRERLNKRVQAIQVQLATEQVPGA